METTPSGKFSGSNVGAVRQERPRWGHIQCPRRGGQELVDLVTGVVQPMRCRSRLCPVCLPLNAWAAVEAVSLAKPENFFRLTMATPNPADLRWGMGRVRQWWRRNVGPWQDVYVIEDNPEGNGLHVHGWQHGSSIDDGHLEKVARRAGFLGSPYGEPRVLSDGAPLGYFLKGALYQPALVMPAHAKRHLELHPDRLLENTQKFWRDEDARPLASRREAEQIARGRNPAGVWVTTTTL